MPYLIKKAFSEGKINNYFKDFLLQRSAHLPEDMMNEAREEAELLSSIGVESGDDHKCLFYITLHAPHIGKDICGESLAVEELSFISDHIFKNRKTKDISTILNFYLAVSGALKLLGKKIKKVAYPQDFENVYAEPSYDINKWLHAMRDIYLGAQSSGSLQESSETITSKWDKMEKSSFKKWMKFYEEGAHVKYSIAQSAYISPDVSGYTIPRQSVDSLRARIPQMPNMPGMSEAEDLGVDPARDAMHRASLEAQQKRDIIEAQRRKILARIRAAETMLYSDSGQIFARDEFDSLASKLHELKLLIKNVNKKSVSSSIFEDLIIKNANMFANIGRVKSADFLYKIAQAAPPTPPAVGSPPTAPDAGKPEAPPSAPPISPPPPAPPAPPPPPMTPPAPGAPPIPTPGSPPIIGNEKPKDPYKMLESFLSGDKPEVEADKPTPTAAAIPAPAMPPTTTKKAANGVNKYVGNNRRSGLAANAQVIPGPTVPTQPAVEAPAPSGSEGKGQRAPTTTPAKAQTDNKNIDNLLDEVLGRITIEDVIDRLESVSTVFKNREISRQLAIVDMMMDRLGINSYFPSLGEATQKSLEANQYCHTRIDDILGKLKGSTADSKAINLTEEKSVHPAAEDVALDLKQKQEKEKARKERRKMEENAALEDVPEKMEIENVPEELATPSVVEKTAPPANILAEPPAPAAPPIK